MTAVGAQGRYRSTLRIPDFRTLVMAFIADGAASWSYNIVVIAYVFSRTHSAGWITAVVCARWITGMLVGGYAGVLADRYDRRQVLMISSAAATVACLALAVVVEADGPLLLIVAVGAVIAATSTPIQPASGALVPEMVTESDLVAANSILAFLESVIVVIGPGIGALLLLTGDPVYGILLNAASYVVSFLLYNRLRVRSRGSAEPGGNAFTQLVAGIAVLGKQRTALALTYFLILDSAAVNASNVLLPALSEHLHGGTSGYSLLLAANAVGGVIAAGVANKLAGSPRIAAVIMASIVLECVPLWACVYAHWLAGGLVLQVASGIGMVIVDVLAFTALQREVPGDMLGRVLGSVGVLLLGVSVLATVVVSTVYATLGLGWALGVVGLGVPLLALLGLPALTRADREAAATLAALEPRVAVLERLDLLAGATRGLLEQLAAHAEPTTAASGFELITQGDVADALWILTEGELAVHALGPDGARIDLPRVSAPGYVGELGLLHSRERSASVTAATECQLLRIPGPDFLRALEQAQPSPALMDRAGIRLARTASPAAATAR